MNNITRMCQILVRGLPAPRLCIWTLAAALVCAPLSAQTPAQTPSQSSDQSKAAATPETPYSKAVKEYDQGAFRRAFLKFRELAQMGHGGAEFMLGVMYFYGRGVERDQGISAIWFYKSARQGNPAAQLAFGSMFIRGVGVSPDPVKACKWLMLAEKSGIKDIVSQAKTLLTQTKQRMSKTDIEKADKEARTFKPVTTGPLGMK